jgi:hypothetical protein
MCVCVILENLGERVSKKEHVRVREIKMCVCMYICRERERERRPISECPHVTSSGRGVTSCGQNLPLVAEGGLMQK